MFPISFSIQLFTDMRSKLTSKAQSYVKDKVGQLYKFVQYKRLHKDNASFLEFVEKSKQCPTNQ